MAVCIRSSLPFLIAMSLALLSACSEEADGRRSGFRIDPESVTLHGGEQQRFKAVVPRGRDTRIVWSIREASQGGTINEDGLYTAPTQPGIVHVQASTADRPDDLATAVVRVRAQPDTGNIDASILPIDRRTRWAPGIPGGIPTDRQVHVTLAAVPADGTGDASPPINAAIEAAHEAYRSTGKIQEVVLPEGTFRLAGPVQFRGSGVVLRGAGMGRTRLRYDGDGGPAIVVGQRWGSYTAAHGPFALREDAFRGTRTIVLASADAKNIQAGDILCIDEEDDPAFVRLGDAVYEKRQPEADRHGPPLRAPGKWRSVTSMIRVESRVDEGESTKLTLADPLHMDFRVQQFAQVFHTATEATRAPFEGVHYNGVEDLYFTGGHLTTNNAAFCWIRNVEADGNPGTTNVGTYERPGGITGRSIDLFSAYRCEVRGSYIHHSRDISQGGGAYLLSLSSYTSETLVEDNIVVFGNKLIVGNMMGGGNVIAYNYVDNARTNHESWQEGAIDLNHQAFTHNTLVEGNWSTNITSDTTHGNAGWHVFFRNFATGQNSAPIYGAYPYTSGSPDGQYRRAAGTDGFHREATYVGNVLHAGEGEAVYQVDNETGAQISAPAVWRIGWGVDGGGGNSDDGTALRLLHRHGNWDIVAGAIRWDPANAVRQIPPSLYLERKPAFFGDEAWPWVEPNGQAAGERLMVLPAKARYDALSGR